MLNGTNKLCQQCKKDCKQYAQITVVKCPNYQTVKRDLADSKQGIPSKLKEFEVRAWENDDFDK